MTTQNYTIRHATPDDAGAVTAMWLQLARQHAEYDSDRWAFAPDAVEKWREHYMTLLAKDGALNLVAEEAEGTVVGFLTGGANPPAPVFAARMKGEIGNVFVEPAHRKRGVARRLTEAAFAEMQARGAEYVTLIVASENDPAIALYRRLGMRTVAVQMIKTL